MDNKLNEIRRKIRFLRAEMLGAEDNIRKQVNRDEDCSEAAVHLMSMRVVMLGLIGERNRLGGEERLLDVDERLKLDVPRRQSRTKPCERRPSACRRRSASETRPSNIRSPVPFDGTEKARGRRER